jgi:hypothetical protein
MIEKLKIFKKTRAKNKKVDNSYGFRQIAQDLTRNRATISSFETMGFIKG